MRQRTILCVVIVALSSACTGKPGLSPSPGTSAPAAVPATRTPSPTQLSTAPPTASPAHNTVYTAEDEEIAILIEAGTQEAIPQLKRLNAMDPGKLEDLFLPLGVWITSQRAGVEARTPSSCTTAAVALFIEGIDRYDDIRKEFLAWRDWGANGHAFPVAAPGQAVVTLEEALVELEVHCAA